MADADVEGNLETRTMHVFVIRALQKILKETPKKQMQLRQACTCIIGVCKSALCILCVIAACVHDCMYACMLACVHAHVDALFVPASLTQVQSLLCAIVQRS